MKLFLVGFVLLSAVLGETGSANAHALQPGYLELQAFGGNSWRVVWRVPDVRGAPMPIEVRLPSTCTPLDSPSPRFDGTAWIASWVTTCPAGLTGGKIAIDGLAATQTDVLVRYEITDGVGEAQRLTPDTTAFVIPPKPGAFDVLHTYFLLGVEHILEGFDHLLFVFALLLLIPDRWRLIGAITAFTVAHSLTLAVATLGFLVVAGPPVEAVIALSIMFLASELLRRRSGAPRLSQRYPWIVSFAFGLLHGLGFAGALREIGLPEDDVPLALLSFNLGVEAGQLAFIAAVTILGMLIARILPTVLEAATRPRSTGATAVGYAVGGTSAFWFVSRVAAF